MDWNLVREIAVALSAIVAATTFLYKVRSDAITRRRKEVLAWQRTVVHAMFQSSQPDQLRFEDILQRYRTEAIAFSKHTIEKDELTKDALRTILMTLVSTECILQLGDDRYRLKKEKEFGSELAPIMTNAMESLATNPLHQMLTQQLIVTDQIVNLVAEQPSRYSTSDVVLKLSSSGQIPQDRTSAILRRLVTVP